LIALRKTHPAFRLRTTRDIQKHLEFIDHTPANLVAYQLKDYANGDSWKNILVIYNANPTTTKMNLPSGKWRKAVWEMDFEIKDKDQFEGTLEVPSIGMVVMVN